MNERDKPTDDFTSVNKTTPATRVSLNENWQFTFSKPSVLYADIVQEKHWESIDVPHTPKIEPQLVNDQFQGVVWYKKAIEFNDAYKNKVVYIRFEAAMRIADVWFNGKKIGHHKGGYLPFVYDISALFKEGESNELYVRLDNRDNEITGPKPLEILDFNTYGGIYRDVNLLVKNKVHVTDEIFENKVAGGGIFVRYPEVSESQSVINVRTDIRNNDIEARKVTVLQTVSLGDEVVYSNSVDQLVHPSEAVTADQSLTITNPNLWSPKEPNLYLLTTSLFHDGALLEEVKQKIGIRSYAFNENHQLLINGELTHLRGVNRHQEHPHVGYATSYEADYRDAYRIKSAGFDFVRLSHYPQSDGFMDAANELGLVLLDAILGWQFMGPMPEFGDQIEQTCRDLIRRNRNHPSVLAWECSLNETNMPDEFIERLHSVVKQEYPSAISGGWQLGYDIYVQARQHRLAHYEDPTYPYLVSEYGDWEYYAKNAGLNQDAWANLKKEERSSRQLLKHGEKRLLQQAMNLQEAHNDNYTVPAFADGYWVMFDYNRGYAEDLEASGIMNLYRIPKYSYYFFQSQRNPSIVSEQYESGPMVHIASEWNEQSSTDVRVFSNVDTVKLYLNGKLIAEQKPDTDKYSTHLPHPPFTFSLGQFTAGELMAEGYINGEKVASHFVRTPTQLASIDLYVDDCGVSPVERDVVFVHVNLVDSNGTVVPVNDLEIEFDFEGDVSLLNPDPVLSEMGYGGVLIKTGTKFKGSTITARIKGVEGISKTISI